MNRSAQPFAFGRADVCWRALDAQEPHFGLEGIGHVLRTVIVANGKTMGDLLADGTEVPTHTLFERFEPSSTLGGMNADALGIVVVMSAPHIVR